MENSLDTTLINETDLLAAKQLLKTRFAEMIEGYLEDTEMYMNAIDEGLASGDLNKVAQSAHPLKSSSAGLGITSVSNFARMIEEKSKGGDSAESIALLVSPLKESLAYATPKLRESMNE